MDNRKTGTLIAARRQELELTQKELAERLNVSDRAVSKWERGAGFPDVSLLEPLADALGLSVLELIHGQRDTSGEHLSPEAERSVREATQELSVRFLQVLQRYRRALKTVIILMVCGIAGFLFLWFGPFQESVFKTEEVSAAEALEICPFAIITTDDFELSRKLLDDPNIGGLLTGGDSVLDDSFVVVGSEIADPYRELALIEGKPATSIEIMVDADGVIVADYNQENRRCIFSISYDGSTLHKTACAYKTTDGTGSPGEIVGGIVSNQNNLLFEVGRNSKDLLFYLKE